MIKVGFLLLEKYGSPHGTSGIWWMTLLDDFYLLFIWMNKVHPSLCHWAYNVTYVCAPGQRCLLSPYSIITPEGKFEYEVSASL